MIIMWFNILKKPILEGKVIPYGSDTRYDLTTNPALQNRHSPGIIWESKYGRARGYAFKYGDEWLITAFEVLDKGKGNGRIFLKEFVKDLKNKKDYNVWVVTVLPDARRFWKQMVKEGILYGQTEYHFPDGGKKLMEEE